MSRNYALKAQKRDRAGKGVARSLRRENRVPAVIYGDGKEPAKISLESNTINMEYRKGHMYTSLCDMDVDGAKHLLLVRDVQLHPVSDKVEHVDFLRVTPKTKITVEVPVHFINEDECPGLKEKGVLNIVRHEVELVCLATDIPDHIDVDLTGKGLGAAVRISDAKLPQGAKPKVERDFVIATLQIPRAYVEMEVTAPVGDAAAGAEGAAPAAGAAAPAADAKAGDAKAAAPAAKGAAPAAKPDAKK